jgi:hypothetical protein
MNAPLFNGDDAYSDDAPRMTRVTAHERASVNDVAQCSECMAWLYRTRRVCTYCETILCADCVSGHVRVVHADSQSCWPWCCFP